MIKKDEKEIEKVTNLEPITFCHEYDESNGKLIFVAVPVDHEHYPFSIRTAGSISPVKFNSEIKIKKPDAKKISNKIFNLENRYKLKISDFLNHSVEIGQLWHPLLKLIDNYIKFCDQQILNHSLKNETTNNINIKNDWSRKKHSLKEIYDSWVILMSKTSKENRTLFKETRTLIFKTSKIIIPLTENDLMNNCFMNIEQPLVVAWIAACVSLSSIGTYTHAIIKNNENIYEINTLNTLKNKISDYWSKFADLVKNNNRQISKYIKDSLIESQNELKKLQKEPKFVEAIQKYFSKSTHQKALLVLNETENVIKLGLKLLDFKHNAVEYIFI